MMIYLSTEQRLMKLLVRSPRNDWVLFKDDENAADHLQAKGLQKPV